MHIGRGIKATALVSVLAILAGCDLTVQNKKDLSQTPANKPVPNSTVAPTPTPTSTVAPSPTATPTTGAGELIPADRRTTWNPGIPGGIPDSSTFTTHTTVTLGSNAGTNRTNIQNAINAAGAAATAATPRVVQLPAGTYHINAQIFLNQNNVILRGAGKAPIGSTGGTRLIMDAANTDMFYVGAGVDWGSAINVVSGPRSTGAAAVDVPKGASSFELAAGHGVLPGDLIVIDKNDDASIVLEGGNWWKRGPNTDNGPYSALYRSIGQVLEVKSVVGNIITIDGILHQGYPLSVKPQVFGVNPDQSPRQGFSGIGLESMTITGWGDAMGVYVNWTRRSWIKDVEFDGCPATQASYGCPSGSGTGTQGNDTRVYRSVRFTIEHSYLHHSRVYITNNEAYSISLAQQTSDSLVQDNIVWFKNKNVVLEASGGGNVIAYNYLEDPVIARDATPTVVQTDWMEMCMDGSHLAGPTMDLFEGNYVAKMGAAETHGNATYQTFYRNYSAGARKYAISDNAGVAAVMINRYMYNMNFVGNVLSTKSDGSHQPIYEPHWGVGVIDPDACNVSDKSLCVPIDEPDAPKIWSIGLDGWDGNWSGPRDMGSENTLLRVANYDTVRNRVDTTPPTGLPNSLFLTMAPSYFKGYVWPPVDPYGASATDRVKTLPAKARFDAKTY